MQDDRFPTAAEFEALLLAERPADLVRRFLLEGGQYVFRSQPGVFERLQTAISKDLDVAIDSVLLVGSAKTGFSMAPDSFPATFSDRSDLDIAVLSEAHFDLYWRTIRDWQYPRRGTRLPYKEGNWYRARRDNVFWGWFYPTKFSFEGLSLPQALRPLRDESARWFAAFQSLSRDPDLTPWHVTPRLYRCREDLVAYHVDGLRRLSERLHRGPAAP